MNLAAMENFCQDQIIKLCVQDIKGRSYGQGQKHTEVTDL